MNGIPLIFMIDIEMDANRVSPESELLALSYYMRNSH